MGSACALHPEEIDHSRPDQMIHPVLNETRARREGIPCSGEDPDDTANPTVTFHMERQNSRGVSLWLKTIGLIRKTRYEEREHGGWMFSFTNALYNLIWIRNILEAPC